MQTIVVRPISLVEALKPRAVATAAYLARSLPRLGSWQGYTAGEGMVGRLTRPADKGYNLELVYHRPSNPQAELYIAFLSMTDIKEEHRSEPIILSRNVTERQKYRIKFDQPVEYEETLRHTFSKTVSEAEASKAAWEIAAKASLGVEFSGVKAALEVSGRYGEELSRQSSGSETTTDEIVRHLKFVGPIDTTYEAVRSLDKERRTIHVRCDFDGKLYFCDPGGWTNVWEWTTYKSQFLPVIQGLTTDDVIGFEFFEENPPTDAELTALETPSDKLVEFSIDYDNIVSMTLEAS